MNTRSRKRLLIAAAIGAPLLLVSGVFASTQITINNGSAVNLGAGTAAVNVCGSQATVAAQQSLSGQTFQTTTVSITGVSANCAGKILSLAFLANGSTNLATWTVPSNANGSESYIYGYGSNGGACAQGGTCQAQSPLTAFDTANSSWSTVAVAAQ